MKSIWKYISLGVVAILFISTFSASITVISFSLNQGYIIKKLCENRFDKDSACQGKCYLKKQLTKEDERNSKEEMTFQQIFNWLIIPLEDYHFLTDSLSLKRHEGSERLPVGPVMTTDRPPPFQS